MKLARASLRIGLLACVLGGATAWHAGSMLVAPAPARTHDAALPFEHEAITFPSASGSTLRGWYVPASAQVGAVVLMHGVRANRMSMIGRARMLHDAGYSVLLFDFQAHGESAGEHVTFGYLESRDAEAAVAWLKRRARSPFVAAIGMSLGGAAALVGARPLDVHALVLEAVYPAIDTAVENRLEIRLGRAGRALAPLLLVQLPPRLGIQADDLSPESGIRHIAAPVLIIGGDADRHTTPADTRRLFDSAPAPKQLWMVPGAAHVDFERHASEAYRSRVLSFLEDSRGAATAPSR